IDRELLVHHDRDVVIEPRPVDPREARVVERLDVDAPDLDADLRAQTPDFHHVLPSSAAFIRSARNGTVRSRTPVASNTALPSAAGTGVEAASPAPSGGWSSRWMSSNSSLGTSGNVRIGYEPQSTVVTRSRS